MLQIDPHAWVVTIPMTLGLVHLWLLPADHGVRRVLREISRREEEAWQRVGLANPPLNLGTSKLAQRVVCGAVAVALVLSSLASLGAFLGMA